jgi:hypothetical protein
MAEKSAPPRQGDFQMPLAKIHVLEGRYDERRLSNVSKAVQDALISILKIPSDDFFQIIHVLPRNRKQLHRRQKWETSIEAI